MCYVYFFLMVQLDPVPCRDLRPPSPQAALWLRVGIWSLLLLPLPHIARCPQCKVAGELMLFVVAIHLIWLWTTTYLVCFIGAVWAFRIHLLIAVTQHSLGGTPWLPTLATSLAWALRRCLAAWVLMSPTRTHLVACVKARTFTFFCFFGVFYKQLNTVCLWKFFRYCDGHIRDYARQGWSFLSLMNGLLDDRPAVGQNWKSYHFYYYFLKMQYTNWWA